MPQLVSCGDASQASGRAVEIALVVAIIAVIVALVQGGSLESLADTKFRAVPLLLSGLAFQIVFGVWSPSWMTDGLSLAVLIVSNALVLAWLVVNRSLPGLLIAAVGLLMNLAVISANGAMPVSGEAVRIAGGDELEISEEGLKHEVLDDDTRLGLPWRRHPDPKSGHLVGRRLGACRRPRDAGLPAD